MLVRKIPKHIFLDVVEVKAFVSRSVCPEGGFRKVFAAFVDAVVCQAIRKRGRWVRFWSAVEVKDLTDICSRSGGGLLSGLLR